MYVGDLANGPLAHRQTTHSVKFQLISLTCVHLNAKSTKIINLNRHDRLFYSFTHVTRSQDLDILWYSSLTLRKKYPWD